MLTYNLSLSFREMGHLLTLRGCVTFNMTKNYLFDVLRESDNAMCIKNYIKYRCKLSTK